MNTFATSNRTKASIAALAAALSCATAGAQPRLQPAPPTPAASPTTRIVSVDVVPPKTPYFVSLALQPQTQVSFGPGTGTLAITSITLSSGSAGTGFGGGIEIFRAFATGSACGGDVASGSYPAMHANVQLSGTIQLVFPTPFIVTAYNGLTCAGVYTNGLDLTLDIVGYVY